MGDLLKAALASDSAVAEEMVLAVHHEQAPWIIEAGPRFWNARKRYLEGDTGAIIEAYRVLCEGVLRRYASLVIGLEHVAVGSAPPHPLVQPYVADVESRLQGLASEGRRLPRLLLTFVERRLRNADAHANVIVDSTGDLVVQLEDGSHESFRPNEIYGKAMGLRSALDGVDIATTVVFTRDIRPTLPVEAVKPTRFTQVQLTQIADLAASEYTTGSVVDVDASGSTHRITFDGQAGYEELLALINAYWRVVELVSEAPELLEVVDPEGRLIAEFWPNKPTA
jgi:hypothetical protein